MYCWKNYCTIFVDTSPCDFFFFHGPIRSDDQPPVPHIIPIFSIQRDPVCPSWFAPCFQSCISWCCYCMTSLVFHAFASRSLPLDHALHQLTPAVSDCVSKVVHVTSENKLFSIMLGLGFCIALHGIGQTLIFMLHYVTVDWPIPLSDIAIQ